MFRGQEHLSYEGRLRDLGLFSWRRLREDLINAYKYLRRRGQVYRARFIPVKPSNKARGNGQKLEHN